ncbi:LSU ribosomal protein L25P [Arboricoccus pini]|uniref:Large ribosomal subunit protein bL25 n=1 Tax=Arboricoccus pini TaxID=1963835 RepID=A0A212QTI4_9PROT|nr:50S ribosomal protein L25/general stress protein Ctc [Arboricoccus pini]SNB62808.1 LSU ribosomal protein L25P [Arboricoccus pini]
MSASVTLNAQSRTATGKGPARQLRRAGKVPAIIYGGGAAPEMIAIDFKEIKHQLDINARFFSTIFELDVNGSKASVLAREAQLHPVTDVPLHVDFIRAEKGAKVDVPVAVHFVNEDKSKGLRNGGVLNIVRHEVQLTCPADAIPEHLVVDLEGYDIGDSIHISAVALPAGVELAIHDLDFTVASVVPPTVPTAQDEEEVAAVAEAQSSEAASETSDDNG